MPFHYVTGKWSPSTVRDLIRNSLIVGEKRYGERSEGKHRRLDAQGWRYLDESDLDANDDPKTTRNPAHVVISAASGADPMIPKSLHSEIQAKLELRGHSQRGIPRARDPAKYPLSGRVFDLTDNCGSLMYGATQSGRPLHKCGRYMSTGGSECNNNAVDAEALLGHLLSSLFQSVRPLFNIGDLGAELTRLALDELASEPSGGLSELEHVEQKLDKLKYELNVIGRNLARSVDEEAYNQIHLEFTRVKNEIEQLDNRRGELLKVACQRKTCDDIDREVEMALSVLNDIQRLAATPGGSARNTQFARET